MKNATIELLDQVRQASTLSEKISLLKNNRSDFVDMIVADAMDPAVTYGITSKGISLQKQTASRWLGGWYEGFHHILEGLAARNTTGNAAIKALYMHLMPRESYNVWKRNNRSQIERLRFPTLKFVYENGRTC